MDQTIGERLRSALFSLAIAVTVLAALAGFAVWAVAVYPRLETSTELRMPVAALVSLVVVLTTLYLGLRRQIRQLKPRAQLAAARLESIDELLPSVVLLETDQAGRIIYAGEATRLVVGSDPVALIGLSLHDFTGGSVDVESMAKGKPADRPFDWVGEDSTVRKVRISARFLDRVRPERGYRVALSGAGRQELLEGQLRESREAFIEMLDAAQNGIMIASAEGKLLFFNSAMARIVGYPPEQMANLDLGHLSPPSSPRSLKSLASARIAGAAAPGRYERQLARADGTLRDVELSVSTYSLGGDALSALIEVSDITDRKQAGAEIERLAHFDQLTGLPNRRRFEQAIHQALMQSAAEGSHFAVLLVDLDRFKLVNDTLGHHTGDALLKKVAQRLVQSLPDDHVVSRFGGDEFVILAPSLPSDDDAHVSANAVVEALGTPVEVDGQHLQSAGSVGVAIYPEDGGDAPTLIRRADAAMYQAKALGGGGYQFVKPTNDDESRRRFRIENDLRGALEREEFEVYYQPQVNTVSEEIVGVEALVRWNHPTQGLLSPASFIPILEENGLIRLLDTWVLREACLQSRRWRDAELPRVVVSVNVSARLFPSDGLLATVEEALSESGIDPACLELEVTETAALEDVEAAVKALSQLHELGVRTALDDFGTGHSSLVRLKEFPLHTLKIDGSFVEQITHDEDAAAIVSGVIALGQALGLTVIAEGVEHEHQHSLLRNLGCDLAQGFLFARPLPAESVTKLIAEGNRLGGGIAA